MRAFAIVVGVPVADHEAVKGFHLRRGGFTLLIFVGGFLNRFAWIDPYRKGRQFAIRGNDRSTGDIHRQ